MEFINVIITNLYSSNFLIKKSSLLDILGGTILKPKIEILLTYLAFIFSFIATIGSIKSSRPLFDLILLALLTIIWFISSTIKLYKYKKPNKIY